MKKVECQVMVLEHPAGISLGCKVCRAILVKGNFMIGLHIQEDGKDFKYLLGVTPPAVHCGEQKNFPACFKTAEEAEVALKKVLAHLAEKGTTEGLPLKSFVDTSIN